MTDHNRGAYTPQSEAPLAFDARRTRGGADRPFPLALVVSALILAAIVIALFVFLMRQPDGSESVEEAGTTIDAMKLPPPESAAPIAAPPPGMQVVTEDPLATAPEFVPPPEQPVLRPSAPAAAAPAPADPVGALTVSSAPAAAKAPAPSAAPKAPAAPAPKAAPAASGPAQVQIGAYSSAALAERGWNDVAAMFPGQMAGKTKRVEPVESNGATLHRAFIGGFSSREEAQAFCEALKGRGRQCLVR